MSNRMLDTIRIDTPPPSEEYLRRMLGDLYDSPRSWQRDFKTGGTRRDECPLCKRMFAGDIFRRICRECYEQEFRDKENSHE